MATASAVPSPSRVMRPSALLSDVQSNAEILLWQARYRAIFAPLIGFSTLTLKWFDAVSSESILTGRFDQRTLLGAVAVLLLGYVAFHRAAAAYLRRAGRAGTGLVLLVIASDLVVLFAALLCLTPPEHYARALIISIFTVQSTQLFFGWTATVANLVFIAIGYTSLVAVAADLGSHTAPTEELWTLALYGIGVLAYVALQGHVIGRMRTLVDLFTRAQEGDFTARYREEADQMPDPVAVIGRAYNRMRSRLETIVLTDPLSGCFNRRGLSQLAEREVSRAVRGKRDIAVLAIDVDHFKDINDAYGHLTGDEVIREIGTLLRETARDPDVVARIGGEEFVILAADSGEEGARTLADRVLAAFRGHRFRSLPPDVRVTTSVGIAAAPARDAGIAETLLARADEALYIAKRNGRNRAERWHAGMRAFDGSAGVHVSSPVRGAVRGDAAGAQPAGSRSEPSPISTA
jgi:diguanylate cyclase (GGDEF)-like protein